MKITKITKIKLDSIIPVYDITVCNNHNFALSNGCIVHNSKDLPDATCGICKSILDNLETFKNVSQRYQLEATTKLYQELYHKDPVVENLENRIKNIFGNK